MYKDVILYLWIKYYYILKYHFDWLAFVRIIRIKILEEIDDNNNWSKIYSKNMYNVINIIKLSNKERKIY